MQFYTMICETGARRVRFIVLFMGRVRGGCEAGAILPHYLPGGCEAGARRVRFMLLFIGRVRIPRLGF